MDAGGNSDGDSHLLADLSAVYLEDSRDVNMVRNYLYGKGGLLIV